MTGFHHTEGPSCPLCTEKLDQAHPVLQRWFLEVVKIRYPDAHVSWSYRGKEEQEQAFSDCKTRLHFPNSPHNRLPALALDLFQINADGIGIWAPKFFAEISRVNKGEFPQIVWGGTFKTLGDYDHFELLVDPDQEKLNRRGNSAPSFEEP